MKADLESLSQSHLFKVGVLAFLCRLLVSPISANSWDMYLWFETAEKIVIKGEVFTFYTSNPSMHYALPPLWGFYLASVFTLYPAPNSDDLIFRFLVKLPIILSDIAIAILVRRYILAVTQDKKKSDLAATIWLLHPHVFFISGIWGMPDSISVLFLLLSIYLLFTHRTMLAGVSYGLSVMTKHYTLFAYPFLLASIFKSDRNDFIKFLVTSTTVVAVISLPFLVYDQSHYFESLLLHTGARFPHLRHQMSGIYQLISLLHAWKKFRVSSFILTFGFKVLILLEFLSIPLIYYSKLDRGSELNICCMLPSIAFVCLSLNVAPQYLVLPIVFLLIDILLRERNRSFLVVSIIPFFFYIAFAGFFHPPIYYVESVIREAMDSVVGPFSLNVYMNTLISLGFFFGYAVYFIEAFEAVSTGLAERFRFLLG